MQGSRNSTGNQVSGVFGGVVQRLKPWVTTRRIAYSLAGACVVASAAVVAHAATDKASEPGRHDHSQSTKVENSSHHTLHTDGTSTTSSFSSSTMDGDTTTSLNVNGQDVPVPGNGSTEQTITSDDGTRTTIRSSSHTNTTGNSSSVSVDVHNSSSSVKDVAP